MLPGTAACMHFPEKTCPSLSVKGNAEALSRVLNFWQYRTVQLPAAAAQRINQGWRTGAEEAPQVPRGWLVVILIMSPADTTHKLLRESMRSLLTALLCALSENTGHSFTPLAQLSGSGESTAAFQPCLQITTHTSLVQNDFFFSAELTPVTIVSFSFFFPPASTSRVSTKRNRSILGCQGKNLKLETNLPWRYKEENTRSSTTN